MSWTKRIIAPGETVGTLASSAQQSMHLAAVRPSGPRFTDDTYRLDVASDIACHDAVGFGPAQQSTHRLQPAVDGSRLETALRHHVLPPGDQVVLGEPGEFRWRVVQVVYQAMKCSRS